MQGDNKVCNDVHETNQINIKMFANLINVISFNPMYFLEHYCCSKITSSFIGTVHHSNKDGIQWWFKYIYSQTIPPQSVIYEWWVTEIYNIFAFVLSIKKEKNAHCFIIDYNCLLIFLAETIACFGGKNSEIKFTTNNKGSSWDCLVEENTTKTIIMV